MNFLGHNNGPGRRPPKAREAVTRAARTFCHRLHRTAPGPRPPAPSRDGPSSERALSAPPSSQNYQDRYRPGKSVPAAPWRRTVSSAGPREPLPLAVVAGFAQERLKLRTNLCGMRDTRLRAWIPQIYLTRPKMAQNHSACRAAGAVAVNSGRWLCARTTLAADQPVRSAGHAIARLERTNPPDAPQNGAEPFHLPGRGNRCCW